MLEPIEFPGSEEASKNQSFKAAHKLNPSSNASVDTDSICTN